MDSVVFKNWENVVRQPSSRCGVEQVGASIYCGHNQRGKTEIRHVDTSELVKDRRPYETDHGAARRKDTLGHILSSWGDQERRPREEEEKRAVPSKVKSIPFVKAGQDSTFKASWSSEQCTELGDESGSREEIIDP